MEVLWDKSSKKVKVVEPVPTDIEELYSVCTEEYYHGYDGGYGNGYDFCDGNNTDYDYVIQ